MGQPKSDADGCARRILTAEEILEASDMPVEWVATPEWAGGATHAGVYVRTVSAAQRDEFENWMYQNKDDARRNVRAKICALCIADAEGRPLFDEHQVDVLGQKSARAIERVFTAAMRLNGFSDRDVDELGKNSASGPSAAS